MRAPNEESTWLVLLRPTGRRSSPDIDKSAENFLARLRKEGSLMSVGRAETEKGEGSFDVLTIRATDAGAAMKLVAASPLIANGVAKPEILSYRNVIDPSKRVD